MSAILRSRKAKAALASILGAIAAGLTGEMTWSQVVYACVVALAAYSTGVAIEDAGRHMAGQ